MTTSRLGVGWMVLALAAGAAFAGADPPARDEIAIALRDRVVKDLSSSGLTLAFHLGLTNPAAAPRELVRYRYRVTVGQKVFLNMAVELDAPLSLPPGRETLIALPVKITYALLRSAVGPVEGQAVCDVVGEMTFLTERKKEQRTPFALSGPFPIFEDPEIELLPLTVNDMTVGGADVVFRPKFRNKNGYELLVETIRFRLYFGDREVLSGLIPGDKSLPGAGDKTFALPFLLDFFEAGEETREMFRRDALPCRFAGEVEIASAWGRLVVGFEKSQALRLEKSVR